MTIDRTDFEQITHADLQSLIDAGVPEGIAYDYKQAPYARNDDGVRECLKDISAFGNTAGGHLIIGMTEQDLLPTGFLPIPPEDAGREIERLENLVRDGITPRTYGIRMRALPVGGGVVIIIRVPRSWNPPHQVSAKKVRRFYMRNSSGVHEMSVEELRASFTLGATALERARQFRSERLQNIKKGRTPVLLADPDGKLVLHIVPLSAFSGTSLVDLDRAYGLISELQPLGRVGTSARYNFDGLLTYLAGEECHSYTQLYRNGTLEAVCVHAVQDGRGGRFIEVARVTRRLLEALPWYMKALQTLEVAPPFAMMATITETNGTMLAIDPHQQIFHKIEHDRLELPDIMFDDFGADEIYRQAMRPAFDALWNAGGFPRSRTLNANGDWVR